MELMNPLQCLMCVILWCSGNYFISGNSETNECHRVQREFVHRKIGSSDLVPNNPIFDADISVCFDPAKDLNKKSCCSRQSELKYRTASEKYLKDSIRTKNAYLKKLVMDHITQYRERILELIHIAKNKTGSILTDLYNIPSSELNPILDEFYTDVEKYMKRKNVRLFGSVATFFDKLFPVVYKNTLLDGTVVSLTDEHKKCLQEKRQDISPPPFGFVPYNITQVLTRGLSVAKTYLDVLALIVEAINTTDHVFVNEECKNHVTKLQYCSHCQGYVDVKPCKGFCFHALRQCLSQLSVLTQEWEGLIRAVVRLEGGMSRGYDVEKVLENLDRQVDSAVLEAMNKEHTIDRQVKQLCNFQVKIKSPSKENQHSQASNINKNHHQRKRKRSIGGELYDQVLEVMKELLNSKKMYDTISGDICRQEIFYEQNRTSAQCWNGTAVGRYSGPEEEVQAILKKGVEVDRNISALKDKLSHMRLNIMTVHSGTEMMSDDQTIFGGYGSGGNWGDGPGYTLEDDEDFDGSSGSGEGSGKTPTIVTKKPHQPPQTPPPQKRPQTPNTAPQIQISSSVITALGFTVMFLTRILS